jgi:hypothetical protein
MSTLHKADCDDYALFLSDYTVSQLLSLYSRYLTNCRQGTVDNIEVERLSLV